MYKYLISIFLFLPLFTSASFDRDLYYGMHGDSQVQELQEFLIDKGFYSGPVTGNFFSLTQKAVKAFQTTNLVSSTGYFGPLTRSKANSLLSSVTDESGVSISPAITAPKTNDDVVAKLTEQITLLQQQLAELQKQQASLVQQNQSLQTIQSQQQAQASVLGAIQTNTAPVSAPAPASPQPVPDIHSFSVLSGPQFNFNIRDDGVMVYYADIRLSYETGKSYPLKRPVGMAITASSSVLNFVRTEIQEQNWADFRIPLSQAGTYPITFSANGATYNYNLVFPASYGDNWKNIECKDRGAFCESKDVAWFNMTPRVEKEAVCSGYTFGAIRFKGMLGITQIVADPPLVLPRVIDFQNRIRLDTGSNITKEGTYTVKISAADGKQISGFPLTYTFTVGSGPEIANGKGVSNCF